MVAMPGPGETAGRRLSPAELLALFGLLLGLALTLYDPSLRGPFLSDDRNYLSQNPYVQNLSLDTVLEVFDPRSQATQLALGYAPLHNLGHGLAWTLFGPEVLGHHVVNVVLHALAALLLVVLFLDSGIPVAGALLGGGLFLVHPANVEAVAWVSQLKSGLALVLALLALQLARRLPPLGLLLFVLALLAKPAASFALPFLVIRDWTRDGFSRWRWWLAWAACLAGYAAIAQLSFLHTVPADAPLHPDPFVLGRTIATIALRYLVMAFTSSGLAAFHEPILALSSWDPWWLAALGVLTALGARALWALACRREEAAYWLWALAAFLPISQIVPFIHPMGDRYLYFILPGLLGATLLGAWGMIGGLASSQRRQQVAAAALALGIAFGTHLGVRTHARASLWVSEEALMRDSARRYPDGLYANLLRLRAAGARGDAGAAVAALEGARRRGFRAVFELVMDPTLAPFRADPRFQSQIDAMAAHWIEKYGKIEQPTQLELRGLAIAHFARGEMPEAVGVLEQALELGGPFDDVLRGDLANLKPTSRQGRDAP